MRLVKYLRVSTEESAKKEISITFQDEYLDRWAQLHGHEIVATYRDNGFTAVDLGRPGLNEMLEDLEVVQVDGVLVYLMDRLVRDNVDYVLIRLELRAKGVGQIVSATQNFDATPEGRLMEGLSVIMAQYRREDIRRWCMAGKDHKARKGGWTGGRVPFGYRRADRELRVHPVRGPLVTEIFRRAGAGEDLQRIRAWLERTTGKTWPRRKMERILLSPRYLGLLWWHGELYKANHRPLVDFNTWKSAIAMTGREGGQLTTYDRRMIIPLDAIEKAVHQFGLK